LLALAQQISDLKQTTIGRYMSDKWQKKKDIDNEQQRQTTKYG
jgi:hypothetical protein